MIAERGLFRGMRKRKGSPHLSGCWQASLVWQPEKMGELRGLQISHLISIPFRLERGKRGCCLQKVGCFSCPSAIWFQQKWVSWGWWELSEDPAHCCCAAVGPLPPTPSIRYFRISEKQVGSWAAAELCVRGLLSWSNLYLLVVSGLSTCKEK